MSEKRIRTATIFTQKSNQEGMHNRYKNTICTLNDLMKDASLVKHRRTLDEVAKAVTRALESDQKWSAKCKMLQAELDSNESRMKIALELSGRDKNAIISLQNDLKKSQNFIEELKRKSQEDFKQNLIGDKDGDGEEKGERTDGRDGNGGNERTKSNSDKEAKRKAIENGTLLEEMTENQERLHCEIERMKLQVFELEEELANKEKCIEELTNTLTTHSNQLENAALENIELRKTVDELRLSNDANTKGNNSRPNKTNTVSKELKLKEMICNLKNKLHDISKKDQISLEKVKHLIKKNKILCKQLQTTKNQNNLMKLELAEQRKMLNLLSCQFCKLDEKGKKQATAITELEHVRNKYIHMVGNLEQELHEMRKKSIF